MQWRELVPRLREAGFSQARVRLKVEPSDQMRQYLAARETPASLPTRIDESQDPHALPNTAPQETVMALEPNEWLNPVRDAAPPSDDVELHDLFATIRAPRHTDHPRPPPVPS